MLTHLVGLRLLQGKAEREVLLGEVAPMVTAHAPATSTRPDPPGRLPAVAKCTLAVNRYPRSCQNVATWAASRHYEDREPFSRC